MRLVWCVLCVALFTVGCGDSLFDDPLNPLGVNVKAEAAPALDGVELMQAEAGLFASTFGTSATLPDTAEGIAVQAAGEVSGQFSPSGCASASADGATMNLTLNSCTDGPFGLAGVTGTLVTTYTASSGSVSATIQATSIEASGTTHALQATANYAINGDERSLTITTQSSGTGSRGNVVARNGAYTASWNTTTDCMSLSGSNQAVTGSKTSQLAIANYTKCGDLCPADGSVTWQEASTGGSASQVVITFDGSSTAQAISGAAIGNVNLSCQ